MSLVSGPGRAGGTDQALHTLKHVAYIKNLDTRKDELEYWLTEHLRLNGVYWGLTALYLLGHPDALPRNETIDFVLSCQRDNGGFGAAPGHDAHMLYTVSAVQILATVDAVDELEKRGLGGKQKVGAFIASLQNREDGSFMGDPWGETDTRFLYGALNALSLLGLLDLVDVPKAVTYVQSCENFDGGYGICPGAESHAGQVFTCVGALTIAGRLDLVNKDRLGAWLSERQVDNGGFNGRPEKLVDACYTWWVGSALAMIDRLHWIDGKKLASFVLQCQDPEAGGFADRPGNMVDVYHTHFGLAGLSLLGFEGLQEVDPVYQNSSVSSWYTPAADVATDTLVVSSVALDAGSSGTVGAAKGDEWYGCASFSVDEGIHTATLPVTPIAPHIRFRHSDVPWRVGSKASNEFGDARSHGVSLDNVEADKERADEMSRLKGVLWPGMDIFDSATELMRRKRNQKKDGKVLKTMEWTSSQVEPTELIFSPTGTLKKQRVISGNVDDDSPLKGETPVPKRRQPRPKIRTRTTALRPLRPTDPNLPRAQDRKRAKKTPQMNEADDEWHDDSLSSSQFARLQSIGQSFTPEDDDFALSTKAFGKRPHKGFAVFADDDQDKQNFPDQQAAPQDPLGTLTPARLIFKSKAAADNHAHQTDQSSMDKENMEPILNPQGFIDFPSWNHSPFLKRCNSNDALYPRYFLGQPQATDLASNNGHAGFGFCSNPLLAPSTQMDFYDDDNPFEVNMSVGNTGWATVTRSASSEATVSQVDSQELAELYLIGNAD
ncbi:DNA mismatch repair protein msh3 [Penicillium atrosanguineum]|nr:DNA mismatch repair protein msh3 [Penicillium atrosanguineum]